MKEDTTAYLKKMTIAMVVKETKCQESYIFLAVLVKLKLGTKEMEGFLKKQEKLQWE